MANLTITLDDALLRRARIRAAQEDTSVNAVLRDYITSWAGRSERQAEAVRSLIKRSSASRSARGGARWSRNDLHER